MMTAGAMPNAEPLNAGRVDVPAGERDAFPPLRGTGAGARTPWAALAVVVAVAVLLGAVIHWWRLPDTIGRGLSLNFDFLWRTSGVGISESRLPYTQDDTFLRLILAGFSNTLFLVLPVCVFAVLIGGLAGVLRLSHHPLVAGITAAYVHVIRNVPLLLQILMWYAIFLKLPSVAKSISLGSWFFLNHRGAFFPGLSLTDGWPFSVTAIVAVAGLTWFVQQRLRARGFSLRARALAWVLAAVVIVLLTQHALGLELPRRGNFNFSGGASVSIEFFTLFIALSVYTSAYIAEVVRGGVLSVRDGQWAAAQALGMGYAQSLVHIILPQAWLAIIPPLVSQIVNIIKNSSLAIAVGFPDLLWSLTTVIGVTNRTVESVLLLFVLYLIPSLTASWLLGVLNRRLLSPRRGS